MRCRLFPAIVVGVLTASGNPLPERIRGLSVDTTTVWRCVGPGGGGYIKSLAWSRHSERRLFAGCDVGGFFISEDAGRTWEARNRGLYNMYVSAIDEDPRSPDTLLLGSPGGIYKSTDCGLAWREIRRGLPPVWGGGHSLSIAAFARTDDAVYAAVARVGEPKGAPGGIWKSTDGGESWAMVVASGLDDRTAIFDFDVRPGNPREMLVSTADGMRLSEDGGVTWRRSNEGLPAHRRTERFARCKSHPDIVYLTLRQKGGESPWSAGVYRSDDGGRTWKARNAGLPQGVGKPGEGDNFACWFGDVTVDAVDPDRVCVFGATWVCTGCWKTTDGGRSWTRSFPNRPTGWIGFWGQATRYAVSSPIDGNRIAFATGGGVVATSDGAASWYSAYGTDVDGALPGSGLEVTCLHEIIPSRHQHGRFYLGYWDIGLLVTDDDGRTLRRCVAGIPGKYRNSCFSVAEAPDDPRIVFAGFGEWGGGGSGIVARSEDGGVSWNPCTNAANGWVCGPPRDLVVLGTRQDGYRVLTANGQAGLLMSRDGGGTWKAPVGFSEAGRVRALAALPDRIYAGATVSSDDGSAVFVRSRGEAVWRRITPKELRIGPLRHLAAEGNRILISARGDARRPGGAWLSTDAGETWRQVLADGFVEIAKIVDGVLYASLQDHPWHDHSVGGGLIRSRDDGATWTVLDGPGLQNWNVSALAISPADRQTLWVGTAGNSVYVGRPH